MFVESRSALSAVSVLILLTLPARGFEPKPDIGYPAGLIPECPGVFKNASIQTARLPRLQVVLHNLESSGQVRRRAMSLTSAHKLIAKEKLMNFKKKTVLYAIGFLEHYMYPHTQAVANAYSKRGYNVLVTETFSFLTYIYPKSARLTKVIGRMLGEFLVKLTEDGLTADKLELVGASLGSHVVSHAAKYFYTATGRKPWRLSGLDPAGPCFRALPLEERLNPTDATNVDVLHTNIDGFGTAEALGHVDFYANGGEFQPGDIPYIPCLVICSHYRAIIYWWLALENPKKFIAVKCDSIQDARLAKCYNGTINNYVGAATNFSRPGLYYLPTLNEFPYYRGKDGLKAENEIYKSITKSINSDDGFEA